MDCITSVTVSAVDVVDSRFVLCDDKTNTTSTITSHCLAILRLLQYHVAANAGRIVSGCFTSVVVHQDKIYAANSKQCQTQAFRYKKTPRWIRIGSTGWTKLKSIDHDFSARGSCLTLSISNNQLKCCSAGDDIIKVYSLSGEWLQTYGTHGSGAAGQFNCPYISDDDGDGSVLIADYGNDRLQVMSEQGEFSVLQLQPPVLDPRSAVLFNNHLYVTSDDEQKIYKYSC